MVKVSVLRHWKRLNNCTSARDLRRCLPVPILRIQALVDVPCRVLMVITRVHTNVTLDCVPSRLSLYTHLPFCHRVANPIL